MAQNEKEPETLRELVARNHEWFRDQAGKHRLQHRLLWKVSTGISIAIAIATTSEFSIPLLIGELTSQKLAGLLGILLPAITAYVVLRSPEQLWILETSIRNRLSNLKEKMRLAVLRGARDDGPEFEEEYFRIMKDASEGWQIIKNGK
jgi:hypothetical protein